MMHTFSRGLAPKAFALLALSATTLLGGCWEKDKQSCAPKGSTCDTTATVVDLSTTTGCGLALHLADSTYVIPTGATWTNFHAKAGDKVLVGYTVKNSNCTTPNSTTTSATCPAGKTVELGCISLNTTTTTTGGAN